MNISEVVQSIFSVFLDYCLITFYSLAIILARACRIAGRLVYFPISLNVKIIRIDDWLHATHFPQRKSCTMYSRTKTLPAPIAFGASPKLRPRSQDLQ